MSSLYAVKLSAFLLLCLCIWPNDSAIGSGDAEIDFEPSQGHHSIGSDHVGKFPFSAVGSFDNGCTGPCHVLTAAHCVLNPVAFLFSDGIRFNVIPEGSNGFRHSFEHGAIKVTQRWTTLSDPAYDVALVQIRDPEQIVTQHLGYFSIGNSNPHDQFMTLNMAGYPIINGSRQLWYDVCRDVEFDFDQRRFVDHDCHVRNGSSGSPMWYFIKNNTFREIRALHTSALQFASTLNLVVSPRPQAIILSGNVFREIQSWLEDIDCTD